MQSVINCRPNKIRYIDLCKIWIVKFRLQIIDVFARADLWQVVWAWGTKWGLSGGDQLNRSTSSDTHSALCTLSVVLTPLLSAATATVSNNMGTATLAHGTTTQPPQQQQQQLRSCQRESEPGWVLQCATLATGVQQHCSGTPASH